MTAVMGQTSPSFITEPLQHKPLHIFYNTTLRYEIEPLNVLIAQDVNAVIPIWCVLLRHCGSTSRNQMSVTFKMYPDYF